MGLPDEWKEEEGRQEQQLLQIIFRLKTEILNSSGLYREFAVENGTGNFKGKSKIAAFRFADDSLFILETVIFPNQETQIDTLTYIKPVSTEAVQIETMGVGNYKNRHAYSFEIHDNVIVEEIKNGKHATYPDNRLVILSLSDSQQITKKVTGNSDLVEIINKLTRDPEADQLDTNFIIKQSRALGLTTSLTRDDETINGILQSIAERNTSLQPFTRADLDTGESDALSFVFYYSEVTNENP